ncbi:MAG TPA: helix-turn-helix domain-containing protein [Flavisolibacter sp.]|nr:helix-turn-helix domain-containing protein [Flavisolibacter sp.]
MALEVVTREDLQTFRMQLLNDLKELFQPKLESKAEKQWLKNKEVMQLLKVSANTIQRLRVGGKLKSSKIGGLHYYLYSDIVKLLENGVSERL